MRLMLLRHGKPESESPTGRDFDCPLAKEGFRQAQFIAAQLGEGRKLAESTPVAVLSSPAARAAATARVIAQALELPVTIQDVLGPDSPRKDVRTFVHKLINGTAPVLIVSHKPQLENLISEMIGKNEDLRHGELICLEAQSQADRLNGRELSRVCPDEEN